MKKNMKNKAIIACLAVGLTFSVAGAVGTVSASADVTSTPANTPDTVAFEMADGASVRMSDEVKKNGIRWEINMPKAEYEALEANATYSDVSYGVLIAPIDYHTNNPLTPASVFGYGEGAVKVYDWADANGNYVGGAGYTRIINHTSGELVSTTENATPHFYGSIVNVKDGSGEDQVNNLNREFVAVGYISYTVSATGETHYVFAEENDNVRSMTYIAQKAIEDTSAKAPTPAQKTMLENKYVKPFLGQQVDVTVKHICVENDVETEITTETIQDVDFNSTISSKDYNNKEVYGGKYYKHLSANDDEYVAYANNKGEVKVYYKPYKLEEGTLAAFDASFYAGREVVNYVFPKYVQNDTSRKNYYANNGVYYYGSYQSDFAFLPTNSAQYFYAAAQTTVKATYDADYEGATDGALVINYGRSNFNKNYACIGFALRQWGDTTNGEVIQQADNKVTGNVVIRFKGESGKDYSSVNRVVTNGKLQGADGNYAFRFAQIEREGDTDWWQITVAQSDIFICGKTEFPYISIDFSVGNQIAIDWIKTVPATTTPGKVTAYNKDTGVMSWDAVTGASGYVLDINGEQVEVDTNSYTVPEAKRADRMAVKIKTKSATLPDSMWGVVALVNEEFNNTAGDTQGYKINFKNVYQIKDVLSRYLFNGAHDYVVDILDVSYVTGLNGAEDGDAIKVRIKTGSRSQAGIAFRQQLLCPVGFTGLSNVRYTKLRYYIPKLDGTTNTGVSTEDHRLGFRERNGYTNADQIGNRTNTMTEDGWYELVSDATAYKNSICVGLTITNLKPNTEYDIYLDYLAMQKGKFS